MKRAFGFSSDDADDDMMIDSENQEHHYRDASVVPLKELHAHQVDDTVRPAESSQEQEVSADKSKTETSDDTDSGLLEIFDGVLAIFNEAQPQFIRDCLDRDAQRRYLFSALETSVRAYMGNLAEETRRSAMAADSKERARLQADVEALREREKQAEQLMAEQKTKQLSAQRQKRALTQRIEDSEKKIAELEAEREQSELQIRSLLNKLKVAEVKDGDMSAQREEIDELKNDISAKNAENSRLNIIIEQQKAQIVDLNASVEQMRQKTEEAEMSQITEEDRKMIQDVQEQMTRFEEVKKAKDAKIASQKKQLAELNGQISAQASQLQVANARNSELESQLAALQAMLQDMQSNTALDQSLRERKEMMAEAGANVTTPADEAAGNVVVSEAVPAPRRTKGRRKPKVSAIDDNIDSVNWLLTAPSDENPVPAATAVASTPDPDFGYQPPVKKEVAANDAQLTLF